MGNTLIRCFCIGIEASQTALLLELNHRYYGMFKKFIYELKLPWK